MDNVSVNLHVYAKFFELAERFYEEFGCSSATELIQELLTEVGKDFVLRYDSDDASEIDYRSIDDYFDVEIPF
jgi:hypothetical protein